MQIGVREPEMVQIVARRRAGRTRRDVGGLGLEDKAKVRVHEAWREEAGDGEKDEADEDEKD